MAIALITGGSRGLGRELASALLSRGWSVVIDARDQQALQSAASELRQLHRGAVELVAVPGNVSDESHRASLVAAAERLGGLDLLVNNASTLGATPMPELADYPLDALREAFEVNVIAPLALAQAALPSLRYSPDPRILNVSSDAAIEAYEGWGGYGSSKAALDHLSAVLAVEEPAVRVWAVDPGDMSTQMQQDAFPGEDVSDRPQPAEVVPVLVKLIEGDRASGRYRATDIGGAR
jgi:NAD(P)-dependent dehydrogenase (short-subunit alcohol dehydrogenase family)